MKSKDLKITAGYIVTESKLSKPAKLQLLNFIQKEASDEQLMALMLDGKITKLDEQAKEIVRERFSLKEDPLVAAGTAAGLGVAGILGATLAYAATKIYQTYLSKAGKACAGTSGEARQRCISNYKIRAKISTLKRVLQSCNQTTNPEKCKQKIAEKIKALEDTLKN